ncbi:MAG: hypothetical protein P9E24_09490 [Candidatus Competibacter sp.]|nr:hypothetical protein [Candidatus Competibacter sp.]
MPAFLLALPCTFSDFVLSAMMVSFGGILVIKRFDKPLSSQPLSIEVGLVFPIGYSSASNPQAAPTSGGKEW